MIGIESKQTSAVSAVRPPPAPGGLPPVPGLHRGGPRRARPGHRLAADVYHHQRRPRPRPRRPRRALAVRQPAPTIAGSGRAADARGQTRQWRSSMVHAVWRNEEGKPADLGSEKSGFWVFRREGGHCLRQTTMSRAGRGSRKPHGLCCQKSHFTKKKWQLNLQPCEV